MEYIPLDLLAHSAPLLFILGLSQSQKSASQSEKKTAALETSHEPVGDHEAVRPTSPNLTDLAATLPPPSLSDSDAGVPDASLSHAHTLPTATQGLLSEAIEKHLSSGPSPSLFPDLTVDPAVATKERFHCRFVDSPEHALTSIPQHDQQSHSALSPLSPSSPLYPDGLLTPVWYNQYQRHIPCIVIYFAMIALQHSKEHCETTDTVLASIITQHRKILENKIGVKYFLCLVIEGTTNVEEDRVEERASVIRKLSGLEKKSMLAVSTQPDQLIPFIQHLKPFLARSATKFYAAKLNKMKRKRTRLQSHSPSKSSPPAQSKATSEFEAVLRPLGWLVRYDCKIALMTEYLGDFFEACEHYHSAYGHLFSYLSQNFLPSLMEKVSTSKGKRDREAKMLFDAVAFKLIKLYFLLNQPQRAVSHLKIHVARAISLSEASNVRSLLPWATRIYCSMAELVESAQGQGALHTAYSGLSQFQHAEYWYLEAYQSMQEVDPATQIQILTKAYELFKKHKAKRGTLYVAKVIAETHMATGDAQKALLFMDRIAKSYRNDGWHSLLSDILAKMVLCSQRVGATERQLEYQLEQLCFAEKGFHIGSAGAADAKSLWGAVQAAAPQGPTTLRLNAPLLFSVRAEFQAGTVQRGVTATLHLSIEAATECRLEQVLLQCEPSSWNFTLQHAAEELVTSPHPVIVAAAADAANTPIRVNLNARRTVQVSLVVHTDALETNVQVHEIHLVGQPAPTLTLTMVYPLAPPPTLTVLTSPPASAFHVDVPGTAYQDAPVACCVRSPHTLPLAVRFSAKGAYVALSLPAVPQDAPPTLATNQTFFLVAKSPGELVCTFQVQDTLLRHCLHVTAPFRTTFSVSPPTQHGASEVRLLLIHVAAHPSAGLELQVASPHILAFAPQRVAPHQTLRCALRHTLPMHSQATKIEFGEMVLQWRPPAAEHWVSTLVKLPSVPRVPQPFAILADYTKPGTQYTWHSIRLTLHNLHPTLACQVQLFLDPCGEKDLFYAGPRQLHCTLLPQSQQDVRMQCYLLSSGSVPLFACRATIQREQNDAIEMISPKYILFVEPAEKKVVDLLA